MANFITLDLSDNRGQVTLNTATIASVRPLTSNNGSFVVCIGGACYNVDEPFNALSARLS